MQMGGSRRYRILSWLLLAVVLASGAAGLGMALLRKSATRRPLETALAAYDRRDWNTSALLARTQLKAVKTDTTAMRLLARSLLRQGEAEPALAIYERLGDEMLDAEDYYLLAMEHWRK